MFKAVAKMFDGNKQWDVVIYPNYKTFAEAQKGAIAFARKYDDMCLWVQVLNA